MSTKPRPGISPAGWTREGVKSGPCNTYRGLQTRRDAERGPWVIIDKAAGEIVAGGYPTMAAARVDMAALR